MNEEFKEKYLEADQWVTDYKAKDLVKFIKEDQPKYQEKLDKLSYLKELSEEMLYQHFKDCLIEEAESEPEDFSFSSRSSKT